jgi:hypothetical protein
MSWQAVQAVMEKSASKGSERLVLMVIATHADKDSLSTYIGLESLFKEANMSRRNLIYTLQKLEESGELKIDHLRGNGNVNTYTLTLPEKVQQTALLEEGKTTGSVTPTPLQIVQPVARLEKCNLASEKVQSTVKIVQSSVGNVQPIALIPVEPKEPEETKKKNIPSPLARLEMDLPDWLSRESWGLWLKHRREIRHPVTETQADALIKVLGKFRARGMPPEEVIEQSIAGGWQGLFELKTGRSGNGATTANQPYTKPRVKRSFAKYGGRTG